MFAVQMIDGIGQYVEFQWTIAAMTRLQTGGPELLCVRTAVSDAPLLECADHLGEGVALLALIQAGVAELPEVR